METQEAFARFFAIIRRLRAPGGCPWDIDQTPLSLRSGFIEETFEAVDAITADDGDHVREELGDVLLNVVIIAYMYEQQGDWTVAAMLEEVAEKLIRRHPHVFSQSQGRAFLRENTASPGAVLAQWDDIKTGLEHRGGESVLDQVPAGFPPLLRAWKMQKKAAKQNFDWRRAEDVYRKVQEEIAEVREAAAKRDSLTGPAGNGGPAPFTTGAGDAQNAAQLHLEEEVGDTFFALVNWSRHLGVDPTVALGRANGKFARRFRLVEKAAARRGMTDFTLEELDRFWEQAKQEEAG
ncbi:MAG: nucleoside triphosphate pyrophosphohydrolase [Spirochaetaceae bacterium]|jgi:tetrapyrrole methylase family protein/MazG family protein|nr:nucleoside triphosphate pyrophosphohydrolase [Spirochaetaceae bacterium]